MPVIGVVYLCLADAFSVVTLGKHSRISTSNMNDNSTEAKHGDTHRQQLSTVPSYTCGHIPKLPFMPVFLCWKCSQHVQCAPEAVLGSMKQMHDD